MKANFKNLEVEISFGKFGNLDVTKLLGNHIHLLTNDIGLDDVAREIYYSEGEIDIDEHYAKEIVSLVRSNECSMLAGIKKAIIKHLTE